MIDWYQPCVTGIALYGPSLTKVVPPILHEEYVASLREYLRSLPDSLDAYATPAAQGYVVITACRALHLCETRGAVSKQAPVHWARHRCPQHSAFIVRATEPYFAQDSRRVTDGATLLRKCANSTHVATATSHFVLANMSAVGTVTHIVTGDFARGIGVRRSMACRSSWWAVPNSERCCHRGFMVW